MYFYDNAISMIVSLVLATHDNPIVRPVVVVHIAIKNTRHVSHNALNGWVILPCSSRERSVINISYYCDATSTWTAGPLARVLYVELTRGVHEAEEHARDDRNEVLFVVYMRQVEMRVDVVCEGLVADLLGNRRRIMSAGYREFKHEEHGALTLGKPYATVRNVNVGGR